MTQPKALKSYALASFLLGTLLAFLSFLPSILQNGAFLARDDFFNQQIPFIIQSKRLLLSGGLFQWDWTSFLGADFLNSYAFYNLGSPFFWILLPVPDAYMVYAIGYATILKHGVAALGAYLFFSEFVKNRRLALLGSMLYTFSGFTIVNVDFNHFTDVIALFPFWIWQVERLGKGKGSVAGVAFLSVLNILANYYFAISSLLLLSAFALFRPIRGKALRRVASGLFLGGVVCSFWLVPIALSIMDSPRITEHNLLLRLFKPLYPTNYLERVRVFLMPIESTIAHPFFPKTYSWKSTAIFLPVIGIVFAWIGQRTWKSDWSGRFILFLLVASFLPPLTGLFTLGTNPEYTRWWFGLSLMLVLLSLRTLEESRSNLPERAWSLAWKFAALAGVLSIPILLFNRLYLAGKLPLPGALSRYLDFCYENSVMGSIGLAYLALGLAIINYATLFWLLARFRRTRVFPVNSTILFVAVCSVLNYASVIWWNNNALYSSEEFTDPGQAYYQRVFVGKPPKVRPQEPVVARIDHVPNVENFGALVNRPAIQSFNSVRNRDLSQFVAVNSMGAMESPAARPLSGDSALRALLSVATFHRFDAKNPDSLEPFPYPLPMGFAYRYRMNALPLDYADSIPPVPASQKYLAAVELTEDLPAEVSRLVPLLPDSLAALDWKEHWKLRQQDRCADFQGGPHGFVAHCDFPEERLVFFSVPWSAGWSAQVDGKETEIYRAQKAFMALALPAGNHLVEFTYNTPGAKLGIWISLVAGLILAATVIASALIRFGRNKSL